jgi:hypothetical protein
MNALEVGVAKLVVDRVYVPGKMSLCIHTEQLVGNMIESMLV